MSEIKYVLWDIDGTLINFSLAEASAMRTCFQKYNIGECTEEQLKVYREINDKYWKKLETGELSKKEVLEGRFNEFFSLYNIDTSIVPEFNMDYLKSTGDFVFYTTNAEKVVKSLKSKYKQYAATNGTVIAQTKKLSNSGLDNILDGVFISEQMGFNKPSKEFFDTVFTSIGSNNPNEYMIVGDSLTSDILGGKNAGIKTCWYNPKHKQNNIDYTPNYEIDDLEEVLNILPINKKMPSNNGGEER